jgi:hypothetical protein
MSEHGDFDKDFFESVWPGGYVTTRSSLAAAKLDAGEVYIRCIQPYAGPDKTALEIGPGGGFWSRMLLPHFTTCWFADVMPMTRNFIKYCGDLPGFDRAIWVQLDSMQFDPCEVPDGSVDYVWCYGVFCHFSLQARRAYLASLRRKVAAGCHCFVMFADWDRHPSYRKVRNKWAQLNTTGCNWFYDNLELSNATVQAAGFDVVCPNVFPDSRDTIIHFRPKGE